MGNGTHPSGRKLESQALQSKADETGEGVEKAREAQSKADRLDMKKH